MCVKSQSWSKLLHWIWSSHNMLLQTRSNKQIFQINNKKSSVKRRAVSGLILMKLLCWCLSRAQARLHTCPGKVGSDSTFESLSWCGCTRLTNQWMLSSLTDETRVCWFSVIEKALIPFLWDFPKLYNCYLLGHQQESIESNKTKLEGGFKRLRDAVVSVGHTKVSHKEWAAVEEVLKCLSKSSNNSIKKYFVTLPWQLYSSKGLSAKMNFTYQK